MKRSIEIFLGIIIYNVYFSPFPEQQELAPTAQASPNVPSSPETVLDQKYRPLFRKSSRLPTFQ